MEPKDKKQTVVPKPRYKAKEEADLQPQTVTAKWKKVKWVAVPEDPNGGYWIYRCTNCNIPHDEARQFCPACGAKMLAGDDETYAAPTSKPNIHWERLVELVNADEKGLVLILPRKLGETVWEAHDDCSFRATCLTSHHGKKCIGCSLRKLSTREAELDLTMLDNTGMLKNPWFLTKEQASQECKRLENALPTWAKPEQ